MRTRKLASKERFFLKHPATLGAEARYWLAVAVLAPVAWYFVARVNQADFLVFLHAGRAVLHGSSPYPKLGSAAVYSGSAFVYPYWTALAFVPLALLGTHLATLFWVAASILAYAVVVRLLLGPDALAYGLFILASPMLISLQMGTLTPWLALGVVLAWRWRNRPVAAAVLLALAATAKIFLLPMLLFLLASRRYRASAAALVSTVALVGAGFLMGPLGMIGYGHLLLSLAGHEGTQSWSFMGLSEALGASSMGAKLLLAAVAGCGAALLLGRSRNRGDDAALLAGLLGISLFVTPILWSSYLPLAAVALLVLVPKRSLLALFSLSSWLLVTADRAGIGGDVLAIALVVILSVIELFRSRPRETRQLQVEILHALSRLLPTTRWGIVFAAGFCAALTILAVAEPASAAAIAVQALLIASVVGAIRMPPAPKRDALIAR